MLHNVLIPPELADNYIIRMLAAALLGAIIGLERDIHGRPAGLRTTLLVSLGSAVFVLVSEHIAVSFALSHPDSLIRTDPGRIAAQVITGIGFIGAGTIIKYGYTIKGLTTAACLWLAAGIGMSTGAGLIELAVIATLIGLASLIVFNAVEKKYAKDSYRMLEIKTDLHVPVSDVIDAISDADVSILRVDQDRNYQNNQMLLSLSIKLFHKGITDRRSHQVISRLEEMQIPLHQVRWYHQ